MSPTDNPLGFQPATTPTSVPQTPMPGMAQDNPLGFQSAQQQSNMAAQALGHSNNMLLNSLGAIGGGIGNAAIGIAKGGIDTGMELGKMTAEAGSHLPGQAGQFFQDKLQGGEQLMQNPAMHPQGVMQNIGAGAEHVGEFMAPAGLEKGLATMAAPAIEKAPGLLGLAGKAAGAVTGTLKTFLNAVIGGGSMAAVTGAQTGGDLNQMKGAAELGGTAGIAAGAFKAFGPEISQMLNKADFRLSPQKEMSAGKIADQASQFITDNKILGTNSTKFSKLQDLNKSLEGALQSSLPKDVAVPKNDIIAHINDSVESLRSSDPAVYKSARAKADEAISLLQQQKGDNAFTKGGTISAKDALDGKRSWGQMAFKLSQKGKIDPTVSNEGAFAVEQGYQKTLNDTLERTNSTIKLPPEIQGMFGGKSEVTLPEFNKVYSAAINAKNLTGIAQYKNDAGLFGRLFGLWAGQSLGQAIVPGLGGKLVGAGVGELMSSHLPGIGRNALERGLALPESTAPVAAKVSQAIQNQSDTANQSLPQ